MRPTRLLLSICFVFVAVILTVYTLIVSRSEDAASTSTGSRGNFQALFSWSMPSTLFPQSAIISLTDDNSTFFLSRPAAFGPRLPSEGMSGQLWIGSGFSEEAVIRGAVAQGEGELGCSDIPGWDQRQLAGDAADDSASGGKDGSATDGQAKAESQSRSKGSSGSQDARDVKRTPQPKEDDGTDDYLHWPLKSTHLNKYASAADAAQLGDSEHADIQSLQEGAEIRGKVVLLSRGGCGFLEKTMWVQRRGGVALIVGDNIRGGPLTTMYSSGDSSNISIPSVFTTRTTAHLLSSLIPGRAPDGGDRAPTTGDVTAKLSQNAELSTAKAAPKASEDKSQKTKRAVAQPDPKAPKQQKRSTPAAEAKKQPQKGSSGWFSWLSKAGLGVQTPAMSVDSSRPPSSGQIKWIVSEDWDDEPGPQSTKKGSKATGAKKGGSDEFVIGVQDWRDPDMLASSGKSSDSKGKGQSSKPGSGAQDSAADPLEGGSHTPGSGEYNHPEGGDGAGETSADDDSLDDGADDGSGWLSRMFSGSENEGGAATGDSSEKAKEVYDKTIAPQYVKEQEFKDAAEPAPPGHEGLWVTITPTTVSTTPFFDTLLVLVISPLVTLTIVYALLLLRSRIRRRRWRAPKSVVDRLPVRTYHTMSHSPSPAPSPPSSPEGSSPTSPLLQTSKAAPGRPRPRSRTTSTLADHVSSSLDKATAKAGVARGERHRFGVKRYRGRQSECVVCLEDYVDGQSRVMSLPCGHEFHAECITPWLTTRRRTCPICKGDVVRSLAGDSGSSSTTDVSALSPAADAVTADDVQAQAAQARNDSASAAIPIPQGEADLERGDDMAATLVNDRPAALSSSRGWRDLASRSLSAVRVDWTRRAAADRDR